MSTTGEEIRMQGIASPKEFETFGIVGGGITGLSSAFYAVENGAKGENIHLFEGSDRLGGKIQNKDLNGITISAGPEFIDSEDHAYLAMIKKLEPYGVKLVRCTEQGSEAFQKLNGSLMEGKDFCAAYAPIAKRVMHDREQLEKDINYKLTLDDGRTVRMEDLSTDEYLNYLQRTTKKDENRGFLGWLWDVTVGNAYNLITGNFSKIAWDPNRVDPEIVEMAKLAYCSGENGRSPKEIGCKLFVGETSPGTNRFLYSDCGFRVEGGSEQVVFALEKYLKDKGVNIHMNSPVTSISRENGVNTLKFGNGQPDFKCSKTLFALPAYTLEKVQGLKELGMSDESIQTVKDVQYCDLAKFTISVKPGQEMPQENFFSSRGYECWSPAPGYMTFLCKAENIQKYGTPRKMMEFVAQDYANTYGLKDPFMPIHTDTVVFNYPGKGAGCYGASGPGEMARLQSFGDALAGLAQNGVGVAGTFIPYEGTTGFMNCGVESGRSSISTLFGAGQQHQQMLSQGMAPNLPQHLRGQLGIS